MPCIMKPSNTFSDELVDNRNRFQSDFFKKFALRRAPSPLALNDKISKDYLFPTFYTEVTSAVAVFFCSYEKALKALPDTNLKPVSMGQGRALLALSSYQYGTVLGIPAYNEVAVTIPVVLRQSINPPLLPLLFSGLTGMGYYVASMPVTSKENEIRGHKIWGLPKVLEEISFSKEGGSFHTQVKEASGETYLKFRVPLDGKESEIGQVTHLYSKFNGRLRKSKSESVGKFKTTKYPRALFKKSLKPKESYLVLGNSPSGLALKNLEIEAHPFEVRYSDAVSSMFDLPDSDFS